MLIKSSIIHIVWIPAQVLVSYKNIHSVVDLATSILSPLLQLVLVYTELSVSQSEEAEEDWLLSRLLGESVREQGVAIPNAKQPNTKAYSC